MHRYMFTWLLLVPLINYAMEYPKELLERDKILHDMYEARNRHDVLVNIESHIEGPGNNKPDLPDKPPSSIKEKSKKYAVYGTVAVSVLTTISTLIIHFTTPCEDK